MTKTKDSTMSNSENGTKRNWFDFIRTFVLIAGLISTGCQMNNQQATMPPDEETGSVSEISRISRELDKLKYAGVVSAIEFHPGDYPIRTTASHKRFSDDLLKEYLRNLEAVGVLVRDKTASSSRAYEELGFVMEKTWCNKDVQNYVYDSRKSDNQSSDANDSYSAFEEFAKYCLSKDNKSCADMDKAQIVEQ